MKFLKYLLYIIIVVAIAAVSYYAYIFYIQAKDEPIDALYVMPENAAIVFYSADYNELKEQLNSNSELWSSIMKDQSLVHSLQSLDSLYIKIAAVFPQSIEPVKAYYSIHFVGYKKFKGLLSFSTMQEFNVTGLENQLSQFGVFRKRKFEGEEIYILDIDNSDSKYHIRYKHGVVSICNYGPLIEKIILEEEIDSELKKKNVARMLKISGKDASASIFINYQYMYRLIADFANEEDINIIKQLGSLSQFTVLDFNQSENHFSFNGFSFESDTIPSMLSTFRNYDATTVEIFDHIPAQTAFVYYQGANKLNDYLLEKSNGDFSVENKRSVKSYQADLMIDIRDYFYPWIKSELAYCILSSKTNKNNNESFALMNTYDSKEASQTLSKLNVIAHNFKNIEMDTIQYRTYNIHFIPLPYLLSNVFGKMFNSIQQNYYVLVDDYVVFANSPSILKKYIDNILIKRTLARRDGFDDFSDKINSQAHLMIYSNMHAYDNIFKSFLNAKIVSYLQSSSMNLNEFGDIVIQFIVQENGAFTSLNLNSTKWVEDEDEVSWQVALDNNFIKGPFIIKNHQTNKKDILVFDDHNLMYRINHLGKIVWAIPVAELPIGDVEVVDFYKNGKFQFVFNSAKHLYMFDVNGNKVEDYPIALSSDATASLSVMDYDLKKNYRIIIPQADGIIHNYQIDGQETYGWNMPSMPQLVNSPIQYFRLGTKDFLLLTDTAGNVVFSNRRGDARIEAKLAFTNNPKTSFYKLQSNLVTTDLMGRIIIIDKEGAVEKFLVRDFTRDHYFTLIDIDYDGQKDYLFYDLNTLYAYNQKRELLWSKSIEEYALSNFQFIENIIGDSCGVVAYNSVNQHYVFLNANGDFKEKDEYVASKNFRVYKATNAQSMRLITAKGRVISNYLLK